jgi:hypothetical protein
MENNPTCFSQHVYLAQNYQPEKEGRDTSSGQSTTLIENFPTG